MVEEDEENAKLMAQLRFIGGQVNMLMELCVAFISANSDPEGLAQRFEATVKTTLTHTDMRIIAQEFFDGELDIVNRIRREVMSSLGGGVRGRGRYAPESGHSLAAQYRSRWAISGLMHRKRWH
jgi:hypothetical protein